MKNAALYILCLMAFLALPAVSKDAGTISPFSFGAGARDLAMGGANMADCDAATAPSWNASALAWAQKIELTGFHTGLYDRDAGYQYFGAAIPTLDYGTFGVGVFRLGVSGIEKRDDANLLLGEFEDNHLGFIIAYGRQISGYDVGMAVTVENHSLDNYKVTSSPGLNLSIGRSFKLNSKCFEEITLAIQGTNLIQPGLKMDYQEINYPRMATAGLSVQCIPFAKWNHRATLAASLTKIDWVDPRPALGLEYSLGNLLHLRGGWRDKNLTAGIGVEYKFARFDYAMVNRDMDELHTFSIAVSLGTSISRKRESRIARREAEFNRMMSDQLIERNRAMVLSLSEAGEKYIEDGNLIEASSNLDRALFLARSIGIDTTRIHELALTVDKRLSEVRQLRQYRMFLDSASLRMDASDYLMAAYFAGLALEQQPNSDQARSMLNTAKAKSEETAMEEQIIQKHLHEVDSLLNYGQLDQAMVIANGLKRMSAKNPLIEQVVMRVTLEKWKSAILNAADQNDYKTALTAIDSALEIFPGHKWCLEMKSRLTGTLHSQAVKVAEDKIVQPEPISEELKKEVNITYRSAQESFEKGELARAIELWEKVERLAPDYQSVREYLIKAYRFVGVDLYSRNMLTDAVAVWKKAVKLDPDNAEIKDYINRTETEIRKTEELSYDR